VTAQPTLSDLMAALPDVLAAPRSGGRVEMPCLRPAVGERNFVDALELSPYHGISGDRWATAPWLRLQDGSGHPGIQVSILPRRVLDLVWRDRTNTVHPGDSFICDLDMAEANLPAGTRLRVGSAVLSVSEIWNDACVKWKHRYGQAAFDWVRAPGHRPLRLRGILCRIETGGILRAGDAVEVMR